MRRSCFFAIVATFAFLAAASWPPAAFADADIDYEALVSQSNLIYDHPRPAIESQCVGNGVMGTMVWTSPGAVHLQINRTDLFPVNKHHKFAAKANPIDQWNGCAKIDIELGDDPFGGSGSFQQRLDLYNAEESIAGNDVRLRCFVSSTMDVMVVEVDDLRPTPLPMTIVVSMWSERGPQPVRHDDPHPSSKGYHQASFEFLPDTNRVTVVQRFDEYFDPIYQLKDYHCRSAVAIQVTGSPSTIAEDSPQRWVIKAPAQAGKRRILIASAGSFSNDDRVGAVASGLLDAVASLSYEALRSQHVDFWHRFWRRTFVDLSSADDTAEFWEHVRHWLLYYMTSSSRGHYPPKWNGSIFTVDGNARQWGSQYWVWTTESHYWPLIASESIDLTDPFFNMYVAQLDDAYTAGRQRWNADGAYYPETAPFDGCVALPNDAAKQVYNVARRVQPNTEVSPLTKAFGRYEEHLQQLLYYEGAMGHITHQHQSGSRLALAAWWRYRHTGDDAWLASHAYPLLKGTAELYRHYATKLDDGLYHILASHCLEEFWCVDDAISNVAAIRSTVPLAIRAAEILDVDAELRALWQTFMEKTTPYHMGDEPRAKALTGGTLADDVWAAGLLNIRDGSHNREDVWLTPLFPYEDWTLETQDPKMDAIAQRTVDLATSMKAILNGAKYGTVIRSPIAMARAGRGASLPEVLKSYYASFNPYVNGRSSFEGRTAESIEHLGILTTTLQESLLQSVPPRPGEPEIVRVFPAWPRQWNASFRLSARGGFLVSAAIDKGTVLWVEIESRLGEPCRLRNPWGGPCVVEEIGGTTNEIAGNILRFATKQGAKYRIVRP